MLSREERREEKGTLGEKLGLRNPREKRKERKIRVRKGERVLGEETLRKGWFEALDP